MSAVGADQDAQERALLEGDDAPEIRYASLLERADTIRGLIIDGTLDPFVGLSFVVWPSSRVVGVQQERWRHDAEQARRRFSPEARERALLLVQGGVSCRVAASVALGDERYRMSVWRWARRAREQSE